MITGGYGCLVCRRPRIMAVCFTSMSVVELRGRRFRRSSSLVPKRRVGMKNYRVVVQPWGNNLKMNETAIHAVLLIAKVRLKRTFSLFYKVSLLPTLESVTFVRHERSKTR
jgi:hypothetical protein